MELNRRETKLVYTIGGRANYSVRRDYVARASGIRGVDTKP